MEPAKPLQKDESVKIVVFRLGDEEFGVDISQVNRIIKMNSITRIPNTPPYFLGVLNLRGGIIIIVDLAMKLGFQSRRFDRNTRIIDIEVGNAIVGMVVDSATELLTINRAWIQPAPSMIQKKLNADYITGVAIIDQRVLIILDLTKVMSNEEMAGMNSLKNAESKNKGLAVVHPIEPAQKEIVSEEPQQPKFDQLSHPTHVTDLPQHPF